MDSPVHLPPPRVFVSPVFPHGVPLYCAVCCAVCCAAVQYHGVALSPSLSSGPSGADPQLTLSFGMEGSGFGAVLATSRPIDALQPILTQMGALTAQPLASYSTQWNYLLQSMVPIPWTSVPSPQPQDTVLLPAMNAMYIVRALSIKWALGGELCACACACMCALE